MPWKAANLLYSFARSLLERSPLRIELETSLRLDALSRRVVRDRRKWLLPNRRPLATTSGHYTRQPCGRPVSSNLSNVPSWKAGVSGKASSAGASPICTSSISKVPIALYNAGKSFDVQLRRADPGLAPSDDPIGIFAVTSVPAASRQPFWPLAILNTNCIRGHPPCLYRF